MYGVDPTLTMNALAVISASLPEAYQQCSYIGISAVAHATLPMQYYKRASARRADYVRAWRRAALGKLLN